MNYLNSSGTSVIKQYQLLINIINKHFNLINGILQAVDVPSPV